jgi:hypothetical protein
MVKNVKILRNDLTLQKNTDFDWQMLKLISCNKSTTNTQPHLQETNPSLQEEQILLIKLLSKVGYILRTKSQGPYGKHTQTPKRQNL